MHRGGRSGQYADDILKGFSGILQVDGYAGYNRLLKRVDNNVALAYCWAHARRKLHEVAQVGTAPIAEEGLKQIAALYRIEKDIRGLTAGERLAARKEQSAPLIVMFETWLMAHRARVSAKAPLGEALKYIEKYWGGLVLFLDDGRIEMDSNAVELTIRPIAFEPQERALCWSRRRSRKLGRHRLPDRDLQAQRCRSACLSGRHAHSHR